MSDNDRSSEKDKLTGKDEYNASLQEELERVRNDMKALQTEFNSLAETDDGTLTPDAARKALIAAAPGAIQQIIILSQNAESESVRGTMSKYITDVTLGKIVVGDPADNSFRQFLEQLKKPATDKNVAQVKKNAEKLKSQNRTAGEGQL